MLYEITIVHEWCSFFMWHWEGGRKDMTQGFFILHQTKWFHDLRQTTTLCVPVSPLLGRNIVCYAGELSAADPNS